MSKRFSSNINFGKSNNLDIELKGKDNELQFQTYVNYSKDMEDLKEMNYMKEKVIELKEGKFESENLINQNSLYYLGKEHLYKKSFFNKYKSLRNQIGSKLDNSNNNINNHIQNINNPNSSQIQNDLGNYFLSNNKLIIEAVLKNQNNIEFH